MSLSKVIGRTLWGLSLKFWKTSKMKETHQNRNDLSWWKHVNVLYFHKNKTLKFIPQVFLENDKQWHSIIHVHKFEVYS